MNAPTIFSVAYPAPNNQMQPRSPSDITDEIVHHSAGALTQTPLEIDQEHRNEGWAMIGYNYVITPNGNISAGRPILFVPAAAYGRNLQSVDICLIGNFQAGDPGYTGLPTLAQLASLKDLSLWLHLRYATICRTIGHGDVARLFYPNDTADYATACPGNLLEDELASVRSYVTSQINKH